MTKSPRIAMAMLCWAIIPILGVGAPETLAQTLDVPIHDPVMMEAEGTFYLFGTGRGITAWASDDMEEWRRLGRVFPETPPWVMELLPRFVGVATTTSLNPDDPDFGWIDHGLVIESFPGRDMWNAIDPHLILDQEGTPWMSFGSHWGGIKLVKMDPGLTRIAEPQEWRTIAARNRYWKLDERDAGDSANPELDYDILYPTRILEMNRASENGAIEAPVIFWRGGYYYLFVSWDRCCRGLESTYKVVVGRSPDIKGPYLDREGEDMAHGGGSLVVSGFGARGRWVAGGHTDVVALPGTDYLVFHAYDATDEGRSKLMIREVSWDRYGWPSVEVEGR